MKHHEAAKRHNGHSKPKPRQTPDISVPFIRTGPWDSWSPWSNPEYRLEILEDVQRQSLAAGGVNVRLIPRAPAPSPIVLPAGAEALRAAGLLGPNGKAL